jgi:glycerophosphoryl diester phosphodiesterase
MKSNAFPLVTAHAGCLHTPPNSLINVLEAVKAGADIVEVDVNTTKDGVAILFHDQYVQTPSYGAVPVNTLTFEEIQAMIQITRLEDVLPVLHQSQTPINLDLKSPACLEPMQNVVTSCDMVNLAIISGCHKEDALFVKNRYPEFQVLLNAEENVADLAPDEYDAYIRKTCQDAIAASCCGININYQDCRAELLQYARLRCLPVLLYTVDQPPDMERFLRLGVHSITTNEVPTLIALREQISR